MTERTSMYVLAIVAIVAIASIIIFLVPHDTLFGSATAKKAVTDDTYTVTLNSKNVQVDGNAVSYAITINGPLTQAALDKAQAQFEQQVQAMGLDKTRYAAVIGQLHSLFQTNRWQALKEYQTVRAAQAANKQVATKQLILSSPQQSSVASLARSEQDLTNVDFETYYQQKYGGTKAPLTGNAMMNSCPHCGSVYVGTCYNLCVTGDASSSSVSVRGSWWPSSLS